jgi:translation initiation factor IF-3
VWGCIINATISYTQKLLQPRINQKISARELRVIGPKGENLGVLSLSEALKVASEQSLDLIEISPTANPPVAKIADFGKYLYEENKKAKSAKKTHTTEIKTVQVKLATGDHDLALKAKKASEWLAEGNRVRIDLFLPGRAKYLDEKFLKERIERMLKLVSVDYKVADPAKKSPKGMSCLIERA